MCRFLHRGAGTAGHRVEEVEHRAAEQAEQRGRQEQHHRPPRDFLRVRQLLLQLDHLEVLGIDFSLQLCRLLFEHVQPRGIQLLAHFLDQQRSQLQLELSFGPLEVREVAFEGGLHAGELEIDAVLELVRAVLECVDEVLVVGHDSLLEFVDLALGAVGEFAVVGDE